MVNVFWDLIMTFNLDDLDLRHNQGVKRFEALLHDDLLAHIDYHREPGRLVFTHTLVQPAGRGKGVAAKLVQYALDYARAEQLTPIPVCSYVQRYMQEHTGFWSV